jgi:NADP-dependent 3-hydroxy acid dehydrogenase YdfG
MKQASIPDFTDQRVWVIGASSGIGEACARALLKRGAKLVLSSRRIDRLEAIAQSADSNHSLVVPVDVMDPSSIARAYQTIKADRCSN